MDLTQLHYYTKAKFTNEIKINKHNTNERVYVTKIYDIFLIRAFVISNKYNLNHFKYFEIFIGHNLIWKIPFELLIMLSSIQKTKLETIITIPEHIFSNSGTFVGIPLYKLAFNDTTFVVTGEYGIKYSIVQRNTLCHINIRELRDKDYVEIINKYDVFKFHNEQQFYIDTYSQIKISGFFIKLNEKLNLIKFKLENQTLFNYDKFMVDFVGKIIYKYKWSKKHKKTLFDTLNKFIPNDVINIINDYANNYNEYLYWIPFNSEKSWNINNCDNYITMPRYVTIEFDKTYSGQIYLLYHNILIIKDGCAMLKYCE